MSLPPAPDITCLVTFHSEGMLAYRTLRSLRKAAQFAETKGVQVEILCILDNATAKTLEFFENDRFRDLWDRKEQCHLGDAGLARNFGVPLARGESVFIMDGDDLVSKNWFVRCYEVAKEADPKTIFHAEWLLTFGRQWRAWQQYSQGTEGCFVPNHLLHNYWCALAFAKRSVFQNIPYAFADHRRGFGYEDMHWNCETLAEGYTHRAVPGTTHFVRIKDGQSRNQLHLAKRVTLMPSKFFSKNTFLRFYDENPLGELSLERAVKLEFWSKLSLASRNFGNEFIRLLFSGQKPSGARLLAVILSGYRVVHLTITKPIVALLPARFQSWYQRLMHKGIKRLPEPKSRLEIPEFVKAQMTEASEVEPELRPTPNCLIGINVGGPLAKETLMIQYFAEFLRVWGDQKPKHLFLLPETHSLENEGALRAYLSLSGGAGHSSLVISHSPLWRSLVEKELPQATFVCFPAQAVFFERLEQVLCKIVLQTQPQRLHIYASRFLTGFLKSFSLVTAQFSEISVLVPPQQEAEAQSELLNALYGAQEFLSEILSSDPQFLTTIAETCGVNPELLKTLLIETEPRVALQPSFSG